MGTNAYIRIFPFLILFLFIYCRPFPKGAILENGILDWDKTKSAGRGDCFRLTGEWKFAWLGETPGTELPKNPTDFSTQISPGSWTGETWHGSILPKYGKALYRLELISQGHVGNLRLVSFDQGTNYRIIFNGKIISEVGRVGDPSLDALALLTRYVTLPPWEKKADLDFEISNYNYRKGGLWKPPIFGEPECVNRYYQDRRDLESLLAGGLLFLGLFHIFVSVFYKKDSSAIILGLFSLTVFLRLYSTGVRLFPEHFDVGPEIYLRTEFISWFIGMPLALHFLYSVFPIDAGRILLKVGYSTAAIFIIITLFTGPEIYSYLIGPSYIAFVCMGASSLFVLAKAIRNKRPGAILYLVGFLILFFFLASEVLYHSEVMDSWELSGVGVGIFVLSNALSLSNKLLSGFRQREEVQEILNMDLEELVKKRTKELEWARDEAEAANRAKSEFLINVDHEVRTPMNGIMGITEMLLDSDMKPEQKEMVELLKRSGDAMMLILGSMLDASSLEKGTLVLVNRPFHLRAAVYEAAMRMEDSIKRKGIAFSVLIADDLPDLVVGDEGRFKRMIIGLLENAEKFTKKGFIRFTGMLLSATQFSYRFRFEVEDSGIGISQELWEAIFTPFQQVDSGVTKPFQGAGLGLSLSRALARKMDGDIQVQSVPGKGSIFILELGLSKPEIHP
ncbi:GHKL domain protein [Leptospira fainei serovar Hurstbridge str. BUT 6]|uniref:histidine kinase n=1 Tax=Leptospira fainei serovar Hurstbridge str. BUT 6 TaxID=1193011 RepID=S3V4Q9_9LEPT|nr:ATP-binding protein [Leptospira fainei]EPG76423.1 GHKL domain protein [Leptospira fainei serovar Hurstbridge str. BUT 6]